MPAPSPLKIATQAVSRLLTEEKYYQKELSQQTTKIEKLDSDLKSGNNTDGNAEFVLKQEVSKYLPMLPRLQRGGWMTSN